MPKDRVTRVDVEFPFTTVSVSGSRDRVSRVDVEFPFLGSGKDRVSRVDVEFAYVPVKVDRVSRVDVEFAYVPHSLSSGRWFHAPPFSAGPAFTLATPIPAANPQPKEGDLAMFGLQGSETGKFLITKIEPGQNLSAIITCVDYAPDVYTADASPPNQPSQTLPAPSVVAPVIASIESDDVHVSKPVAGRVVVALVPPASMLTNAGAIVSIEYETRVSSIHGLNAQGAYNGATSYTEGDLVTSGGQNWVSLVSSNVGVTPGTNGDKWSLISSDTPWGQPARVPFSEQVIIDNVEPKTIYDIQLRYVYKDGTVSDWSVEAEYTVQGQVTGPPDVTSLTANEPSTGVVKLNWPPVKVKDVATYEVRVGASWAAGTFVAQTNSTDYKDHGVAPGTYTYWVGVLDTSGNYDATPQSVVITVV
jgi:hypothetical protein